jgi:hypothetical protein
MGSEVLRAGDTGLRYRIPAGWVQGAVDDAAPGSVVWLVRDDLAATLSIRQVSIDGVTRGDIDRNGLQRFADLHSALTSEEMRGSIVAHPVATHAGSSPASMYECQINDSRDWVRIVLVDTGTKVYQVNILAAAKVAAVSRDELVRVLNAFVNALAW